MMKITDEIFESHHEMVQLLWRDNRPNIMIYEVYQDIPAYKMEEKVFELTKNDIAYAEAVFYRVNLNRLTPIGVDYLYRYCDADCQFLEMPEGTCRKIPYLESFIWGVGKIDVAYEIGEIPEFISELRRLARFPSGEWVDPNR